MVVSVCANSIPALEMSQWIEALNVAITSSLHKEDDPSSSPSAPEKKYTLLIYVYIYLHIVYIHIIFFLKTSFCNCIGISLLPFVANFVMNI